MRKYNYSHLTTHIQLANMTEEKYNLRLRCEINGAGAYLYFTPADLAGKEFDIIALHLDGMSITPVYRMDSHWMVSDLFNQWLSVIANFGDTTEADNHAQQYVGTYLQVGPTEYGPFTHATWMTLSGT